MLISKAHKSIIVMISLDTRFSRKSVFKAFQKTRSACFIWSAFYTKRSRKTERGKMTHIQICCKKWKPCSYLVSILFIFVQPYDEIVRRRKLHHNKFNLSKIGHVVMLRSSTTGCDLFELVILGFRFRRNTEEAR